MFQRQVLLAALLISGTAAVAVAQSGEFPFRRFGSRDWIELPRDLRSQRFFMRGSERLRANAERMRLRLQDRAADLANRARLRGLASGDRSLRLRDHGSALREEALRHRMELRFRDLDRVRDRLRDRMDHFRFERPLIIRRYSRTI